MRTLWSISDGAVSVFSNKKGQINGISSPTLTLYYNAHQGRTGGVQKNPVMKAALYCNYYCFSYMRSSSTLLVLGVAVYVGLEILQIWSICARNPQW